jgi:hypothetical protein
MNNRVIFYVENRGKDWIFHWMIYVISGLRYINTNLSRNGNGCNWGSLWASNINTGKEQNINLYDQSKVNPPFYICFKNAEKFLDFQKQTLDLIKDEFNLVMESDIKPDDIVVFNYGEKILDDPYHISLDGYKFIKNLFLSKINLENSKHKNKKYYLSRSKSHLLDANRNDSNARRRQISNEVELSQKLKELGIETIFLEDYEIKEKIDIFNNSDLIISPNSGGLTFTIFSTENTKIIEINVHNPNQISHQYRDQCNALNVPYYKYTTQKLDGDDNMNIDAKDFCNFINNIK